MKKTLLFCSIFAIAAFNFMSCDDEDENNNTTNNGGGTTTSNLSAEFVGASDCLGSPYEMLDTRAGEDDQSAGTKLVYKYDEAKGELELTLEHAILECASIPKMNVKFSGDTILLLPYNADTSGIHANCICLYDLTSKVKGVESKVYYVRPEYSTGEENVQVLELSQKNEDFVFFPWGAF
ncbi:MAG: hypothetical protein E7077_11045 [Bacteroidales bacterium]|jgi:hypothetical protein|nr:hypothetical protein [Bacteroidales bacterium]